MHCEAINIEFTDSAPSLFKYLWANDVFAVGTCRTGTGDLPKNWPNIVAQLNKGSRGDTVSVATETLQVSLLPSTLSPSSH